MDLTDKGPGAKPEPREVTDDVFLGGRLSILQPRSGYRAGLDAVLLGAAVELGGKAGARVLDVGAGVGTAGLCAAWRLEGCRVTLLERQALLAGLAARNIERNGLAQRVTPVKADLFARHSDVETAGLERESFDAVIANPPFHALDEGTLAASEAKALSHAMSEGGLDRWCRFLATMAAPGGSAILIHKAEALAELLAGLRSRFGALTILPVHARAREPAIRVLVRGIKAAARPCA